MDLLLKRQIKPRGISMFVMQSCLLNAAMTTAIALLSTTAVSAADKLEKIPYQQTVVNECGAQACPLSFSPMTTQTAIHSVFCAFATIGPPNVVTSVFLFVPPGASNYTLLYMPVTSVGAPDADNLVNLGTTVTNLMFLDAGVAPRIDLATVSGQAFYRVNCTISGWQLGKKGAVSAGNGA